jgi:hypothetical protein
MPDSDVGGFGPGGRAMLCFGFTVGRSSVTVMIASFGETFGIERDWLKHQLAAVLI